MAQQVDYIAHWHQLIENFQASPLEFYQSIEFAVQTRAVPEIHWTRVEHKEGGLASGNRLYLRMHRGKTAFDICAAPFGSGFFVSWWLTQPPLRFGFLYTLAFLAGVGFAMNIAAGIGFAFGAVSGGMTSGALFSLCFAGLGVPALLWFLGNALRHGAIKGESTVLAMPLIGWVYERIFAPETYYSVDTALMFQDAVHKAVLDVVDCMTTQNGLRALSEAERKPIMKKFAASV
jgi:hypothetical protein